MFPIKPIPSRRQRGLTVLESLIAIIVAALGILGIVGVQMRTLADTQTSLRRAQAIRLIEDLDERMKATPSGLATLGSYVSGWTGGGIMPIPAITCSAASCDPTQLAAFNLADWRAAVQRVLPLGDANIFQATGDVDPTNGRLLGVMISWRENESSTSVGDATYLDNIDATKVRDYAGTLSDGSAITCPLNRTCHLQYISPSSRCQPYGASPYQYYCGGN